ncbi:MAG TPA: hypothetical protein VN428_02745 [Bryobacteraceae bacterium]|nr:hypothetical protein [Bryobacteraceae bacterium]
MPCIVVVLALAFPRIILALLFFFSNYLHRAYDGVLIPLAGFLFLPLTTLVYAWLVNSRLPTSGFYLLLLIVAVIIDVGSWGGAKRRRAD